MAVWVGTSGWQYKDWRGPFYPPKLAQARWLEHYVGCFDTVEVNNTFYRLPERETFAEWRERTPPGFVMTLKVSRYLTHIKRLAEPEEPVARFLDRAEPLGDRTGPLLLQLPPSLEVDVDRLVGALDEFPERSKLAVEFRHHSWFTDEVATALRDRNAALVLADRGSRVLGPLWATADWGYVRFHEGRGTPRPGYGRTALHSWAERIASLWPASADVYAYFNNDRHACAVRDASTFAHACTQVGLAPTRSP